MRKRTDAEGVPSRKANEPMEPTNPAGHLVLRPQSVRRANMPVPRRTARSPSPTGHLGGIALSVQPTYPTRKRARIDSPTASTKEIDEGFASLKHDLTEGNRNSLPLSKG